MMYVAVVFAGFVVDLSALMGCIRNSVKESFRIRSASCPASRIPSRCSLWMPRSTRVSSIIAAAISPAKGLAVEIGGDEMVLQQAGVEFDQNRHPALIAAHGTTVSRTLDIDRLVTGERYLAACDTTVLTLPACSANGSVAIDPELPIPAGHSAAGTSEKLVTPSGPTVLQITACARPGNRSKANKNLAIHGLRIPLTLRGLRLCTQLGVDGGAVGPDTRPGAAALCSRNRTAADSIRRVLSPSNTTARTRCGPKSTPVSSTDRPSKPLGTSASSRNMPIRWPGCSGGSSVITSGTLPSLLTISSSISGCRIPIDW